MPPDPPAWLLADGRVVLKRRGAGQVALALEAALRSDRRNGRVPAGDLVGVAAAVAAAIPQLAAQLPELESCWSVAGAEAGLEPVTSDGPARPARRGRRLA